MDTKIQDQLLRLSDSIIAYLPNLLAGILLLLLGWLVAWIVKRLIIQFSILIRVDRLLRRSRWEASLTKADVRHGIINSVGNVGFAIVFIIFVNNALLAWKLDILSNLLNRGILFLPKILIAAAIFGLGWMMASWVRASVLKSLYRERIPRASLIAKFVESILLLFFSAIAFVELDISSEIVIIAFSAVFITLCAIAIVLTAVGGKDLLKKIEESFKE